MVNIKTGSPLQYQFPKADTDYTIGLTTKIAGKTIGSTIKHITTGSANQPGISAAQDANNPLVWRITVNISNSGIDSNWNKAWYIDENVVPGETGNSLTHEFPHTNKTYIVKYIASRNGFDSREASTDVIIPAATTPTLSQNTGSNSKDLSYNVSANLTGTGITSAWTYQWTSSPSSATFEDSTSPNTKVDFDKGNIVYILTFKATPPQDSQDSPISKDIQITTPIQPATIDYKKVNGLQYELTADTTDKGIPTGATYEWTLLDGTSIGSGSPLTYLFKKEQTTYTINLKTIVNGATVGTTTKDVLTGAPTQPTLTKTQDGDNPLIWTIIANTNGTNIDPSWTREWFVDGSKIVGKTGDSLTSYQFPLTDHTYTVKYVVSGPGHTNREATIDVKTPIAVKPTLTSRLANSNYSNLSYSVSADLTNTGITSAWSYKWTSDAPSGTTFLDDTAATTAVYFTDGAKEHTLTFTATPPSGANVTTQTIKITTTTQPATIDYTIDTSLKYKLTANITNKGLPVSGVTYKWFVDDTSITGVDPNDPADGSSITYLFDKENTTYQIGLETVINGNPLSRTSRTITTGSSTNAALSAIQVGSDPLVWKITADTAGTNIGSDWTKVWTIDDTDKQYPTPDNNFTHDFPLTNQTYTVKYTAVSPQGVKRTSTTTVTTLAATAPTLSQNTGSDSKDLSYNVSADLTDTGITPAWTYQWTSSDPLETTFVDGDKKDASAEFAKGNKAYTLTFMATPPQGSLDSPVSKDIQITTPTQPASIKYEQVNGLQYKLTANTTDKGLPSNATYEWFVNGTSIGSGSPLTYLFKNANTTYQISLETKENATVIGTTTKSIATNTATNPKLTATQDGNNPLIWTITADTTDTNIKSNWTRTWYIDGNVVPNETTDSLTSYQFALTKHKYTVKYVVSDPDHTDREASIDVTTPIAITPKFTVSNVLGLKYNVSADLTDTGITSAWTYKWTVSPAATITDDTAISTDVIFNNGGTQYTGTFTATPPNGGTDIVVAEIRGITSLQPATINDQAITGVKHQLTADITGTGLPSSGVTYEWFANGKNIGSGSPLTHLFANSNETYKVKLETIVNGTSIGTTSRDVNTNSALQPTLTNLPKITITHLYGQFQQMYQIQIYRLIGQDLGILMVKKSPVKLPIA